MKWPGAISSSRGSSIAQRSIFLKHRVWNLHPDGGFIGLGISPERMILSLRGFVDGSGEAEIRDSV
jgi:hypothetical protein